MEITVVADDEKRDVYHLVVNDEPWKEFHKSIFGARPKFVSKTQNDLEQEFIEKEMRLAKSFALRRLAKKAYHSMELIDLLLERFISPETIEGIIIECQRLGYLDDQEHLARMMQSEKSKRSGPRKILWKIKRKGIVEENLEEQIEKSYPVEEQILQIKNLLETRYRNKNLDCPKERQKVFASLSRRGFDFQVIKECF